MHAPALWVCVATGTGGGVPVVWGDAQGLHCRWAMVGPCHWSLGVVVQCWVCVGVRGRFL